MTTYTEPTRIGDVLKREFDQLHNREQVTIDTGNLVCGTVLGKITASGKYVLHDNAAADGSQNAAAVLLQDADASSADVTAVALVRGPAVVALGKLTFKSGITEGNKTAAVAALAALGIVARTTV